MDLLAHVVFAEEGLRHVLDAATAIMADTLGDSFASGSRYGADAGHIRLCAGTG